MEQSTATFWGTVIDVKDYKRLDNRFEVTIKVNQVWKGSPGTEVKVWTDDYSMWCGQKFIIGSDYLVYAQKYNSHESLETNYCTTVEMPLALLKIALLNAQALALFVVMAIAVALYSKFTWKK